MKINNIDCLFAEDVHALYPSDEGKEFLIKEFQKKFPNMKWNHPDDLQANLDNSENELITYNMEGMLFMPVADDERKMLSISLCMNSIPKRKETLDPYPTLVPFQFQNITFKFFPEANDIVPSDEEKKELLGSFLEARPVERIQWVSQEELNESLDKVFDKQDVWSMTLQDNQSPLFSMSDGENEVIFIPLIENNSQDSIIVIFGPEFDEFYYEMEE